MSDNGNTAIKPGLREVLLSAGLQSHYLELIESEPRVAKEVVNSIRVVLERQSGRSKAPEKEPIKQASPTGSDMDPYYF